MHGDQINNPKSLVSRNIAMCKNCHMTLPRLHQPLVTMATIKLVYFKQSLQNFYLSLSKSQGMICANFIKFWAKLWTWETWWQNLLIAPCIWIKGRSYNIQNILAHTYRVIIFQTGKSVMSNLVQMSNVCAY